MSQFNQQFITLIIDRYGLELDDEHIDSVVATWIGQYDRGWIVKAIVESLHRGRYKIKSVDSILSGWQRSGKLSYNFPPEFEREILQDLPTISDIAEVQSPPILSQLDDPGPVIQFLGLSSEQLNPEESAPFPHRDRAIPTLQPPTLDKRTTLPRTELDPPFRSEPLSVASFKGAEDLKPNQLNPHAKFQLFHTLRAIITPNNLPAAEFDDLDPPSYSTDLA
ncbi:MAG: hypothetical protein LH474_13870 [Chamaesiphon sp.]|nr:hypothetical protein [Chamaesiphon sp.]